MRTPQIPSFNTISDVSLQTFSSASNVSVNVHYIGNPPPNLDPLSPFPLNYPITTQTSSTHSAHQYKTPSNSPPLITITIQHSLYSLSNSTTSSSNPFFMP